MEELKWINQWVLGYEKGETLKHFRETYQISTKHVIGFIYVDHTAGITMHVETFCSVSDELIWNMTKGPRDDNSRLVLRYDIFSKFKLHVLNDRWCEVLELPQRPDWLQHYEVPHQAQLDAIRQLPLLHPLRAPGFPDDIKFMLPPVAAGQTPELVWGRLEGQLDEQHFVYQLLNQPNQQLGCNVGDLLVVRIQAIPEGVSCVCVGKMKPQ